MEKAKQASLPGFDVVEISSVSSEPGSSKKTRNHDAMLGQYFAWYNWSRKHMTLKKTPAVKAGIASEQWMLEQLLTVAAAT